MPELDLLNAIDIAVVAAGLFSIIVWLRRARAGLAALGALILAAVYLAAREYRLELTAWFFQGFLAVFVIILIVILQNDLRRTFDRVARWGMFGKAYRKPSEESTVQTIADTVFALADRNWGALIVLPGRDFVDHYAEGGRPLFGSVSPALLMSLFDPSSPGHDGAVVVEGDRVSRFGVHLPLSNNFRELRGRGTRHAAALGLSELTDALCVVASEERGEVMIARHGRLHAVDTVEALETEVLNHTGEPSRETGLPQRRFRRVVGRYGLEAAFALVLSVGLWWLFVSGIEIAERTFMVPVRIENIDPAYELEEVNPQEVEVVLRGLGRDLYLLDPTQIQVMLDASRVRLGYRTFRISDREVRRPPELTVGEVSPSTVTLRVRRIETDDSSTSHGPDPQGSFLNAVTSKMSVHVVSGLM